MSNTNLTVFEELKIAFGTEKELETVVYGLCSNYVSDYIDDIFEDLTYDETITKINKILDNFGYEHIEQDGGGEGGAEYCFGVFKLRDKFYKAEYYYQSYNGFEYDDIIDTLVEVRPVERMTTYYE